MAPNSPSSTYMKHCSALICWNTKSPLENILGGAWGPGGESTVSALSAARVETDCSSVEGELLVPAPPLVFLIMTENQENKDIV